MSALRTTKFWLGGILLALFALAFLFSASIVAAEVPPTGKLPTAPAPSACARFDFSPAVAYAVGADPVSVAIADFNGDNNKDLVVANYSSNNVSVLLGSQEAGFRTATRFAVGIGPAAVLVADFNHDGKMDMVTANSASNNLSVLLGTGTGAFAPAVDYAVGMDTNSVAIGDFNLDDRPDLVATNSGSDNISVLMGKGDGTFEGPLEYIVGDLPQVAAVADFNNDGAPDVAVTNGGAATISILLNDGTGFQPGLNFGVGVDPGDIAAGDFNADGKMDLVVTNHTANVLSVLLGKGTGAFFPAVTYSVGTAPHDVALTDVDNDGLLDLVAVNLASNDASILLGKGDGTFDSAVNYPVGLQPHAVAVGILDNDNTPDIVTTDSASNSVSVLDNSLIRFADVHHSDYFYSPVQYLYCHGVISGYADNTFRPYSNATRAQFAKIIVMAEGLPLVPATTTAQSFTDVPATHPFYVYIETAYRYALISGYADGTFRPANDITRGQLCKIVVRAEGWMLMNPLTPTFVDVPSDSPFYQEVETAAAHGIISGYGDNTFRPGNSATRGQISKIVSNAVTLP